MTSRIRIYLWGVLAWEMAVILPLAIVFINAGRALRSEDLRLLTVVIVFGALVAAVCTWIGSKSSGMLSALLGLVAGAFCAGMGGLLWASQTSGFEARPAVFIGSLLLSIPSGIGGAFAAWLNRRGADSRLHPQV